VEKAGVSSYFAVEILYEGIFGHVTTFWVFTLVTIVRIVTTASILTTNISVGTGGARGAIAHPLFVNSLCTYLLPIIQLI